MNSMIQQKVLSVLVTLLVAWTAPSVRGENEPENMPREFRAQILQEMETYDAIYTNAAYLALRQGDVASFTNAFTTLSSPDGTNELDLACLFVATAFDHPAAVSHLLSLGMPVDAQFGWIGLTALHVALYSGNEDVADVLLEAGADPGRSNSLSFSALECAVEARLTNRVHDLIRRGADVNNVDVRGISPILAAADADDPGIVRILIEAGAKVNQAGFGGITALHIAALKNDANIVLTLLVTNADVRAVDKGLRTPLMYAAANGALACAEILLDNGAQINAVDRQGLAPIALAACEGDPNMLDFLADRGADLTAQDNYGRYLAHLAVRATNTDAILWCARRNLPLDMLDNQGCSPLYAAVQDGRTNAVQALLQAKANPDLAETNQLWTPLMLAASHGDVELARRLVEVGANLELRNYQGYTALLIAAGHTSLDMIDLLLKAGARADVFTDRGFGILRNASNVTNLPAFTYFLEHGVDPNLAQSNQWPVLADMAWEGRLENLDALLRAGADPNCLTPDGQSPLYIAVRRNQPEVVSRLLAAGADPARRISESGPTTWQLAVIRGEEDVARQLAEHLTPEQIGNTNRIRIYLDLDAPLATNVFVAGLFNEWDGTVTRMMRRDDDGWWYVELELFPGSYEYKFVVDGNWLVDPLADQTERDTNRDTDNSMLDAEHRLVSMRPARTPSSFASLVPIRFVYHDRHARYVSVAGEFNGWNSENNQLNLEKVGLWSTELRVSPGEYGYKFVVDGEWLLDPSNSLTKVVDGATNSLILVAPPAP